MHSAALEAISAASKVPAPAFRFVLVSDAAALRKHVPAWDELAAAALEPNPFYESWMLLPALEAFGADVPLQIVLIYADIPEGTQALCALLPLERMAPCRRVPVRHLRLWRHVHCYLATPLLRTSHARQCLAAFLGWLGNDPRGTALMEWGLVAGDGPFYRILAQAVKASGRRSFVSQGFNRALLLPASDPEAYLEKALQSKRRKELRRLERRLSETGPLRYTQLDSPAEAERWIEQFIELEARGWKGRRASALGSSAANRQFFTRMALEAARRGRLQMLALTVAGRPVAMKCNFLAGDGAFAFKIAYDESQAGFSPGVLLEIENIRRFPPRPGLRWMDSCADPEHFMANRLWLERRALLTLVTATGPVLGDLVIAALRPLRWLYRSILRRNQPMATLP